MMGLTHITLGMRGSIYMNLSELLVRLCQTPFMPRRLPDLTPCDYYLLGHMKALVYETKVDSRAALCHHIFAAAKHLCNHPDIMSATQSLLKCAEKCTATTGGTLEQLLSNRCISTGK